MKKKQTVRKIIVATDLDVPLTQLYISILAC